MKIVLIGPVYPYKGGISHYTGLLCRSLRQKHQVEMVSYKMQYPKFLFKREQKDYTNKSFQIEDTHYLIHTANPFNWGGVANWIKGRMPDLIIIQWWHPYFAPCYTAMAWLLRKYKILFICHNVYPHERFPLDKLLTRITLRRGNYFVVQSHLDEKDLLTVKKDVKYVVTPHPTYSAFKMKDLSRQEARALLQITEDTPLLLFFGFVRKYKGLQYLLEALPDVMKEVPTVQLLIVGDFGADKEEYVRQIEDQKIGANVRLVEGYVPDTEVEKYFAASDLVVLPYVSATQSGIVQIAYGFEKPVVVTNVGGLPDVVKDGKTGYVVEKENSKALAEAIIAVLKSGNTQKWSNEIKSVMNEFSWDTLVCRIEDLTDGEKLDR